MITGLLQNQQKQAEQKKQDEMAAYMGQSPQPHGESGGGLLSGLGGMLQGLGGAQKRHTPGDGGPNADGIAGPNGGKLMSENEVYGPTAGTGSYGGPSDNDEDDILR